MTPSERGHRAKAILGDEAFVEMFESVRQNIVTQLENSALGDQVLHHEAAITLQLLARLKVTLRKWADLGDAQQILSADEEFRRTVRQSNMRP